MAHGSAYALVKAGIVFALEAREGLEDAKVSYGEPVRPADLTGLTGLHEAIWLEDAEGTFDDVVFAAGNLIFDETYTQSLVVQVLGPETSSTQEVVDMRASELAFEVLAEISGQKHWDFEDLELDQFEYLWFVPRTQKWVIGQLQGTTGGHGAACRLGIEVRARRSFA